MTEDLNVNCRWGNAFVKKYIGDESVVPIVAIHGWLDNCASFSFLSPLLKNSVYAVDLPGHGKSSHLPDGSWYHFIDYVEKFHEIISGLKLNKFILLGHSMGAAISVIYSATFPENVSKLVMIDGLGPLVNDPAEAPEKFKEAILSRESSIKRQRRPFDSLVTASKLRQSVGGLSIKSARELVKQQIIKKTDGYYWSYDPKLNFKSSLRMTPEQLKAFYAQLTVPTLLIKASDGILKQINCQKYLNKCHVSEIELKGNHHLHMDNPTATATEINKFL